jgi:hypothetical protein
MQCRRVGALIDRPPIYPRIPPSSQMPDVSSTSWYKGFGDISLPRRRPYFSVPWLPVDPTNRYAVSGIVSATGPPDSELSAMADLQRSRWSHSLLDLLKKIYWDYDGTPVFLLIRMSMPF